MSKYIREKPNHHVYEYSNNEQYKNEFIPCVADMLDIDINSDK